LFYYKTDEGSTNKANQEIKKSEENNSLHPLGFSDPLDPLTKLVAEVSFKEKVYNFELIKF
jgi:hypothetical protein